MPKNVHTWDPSGKTITEGRDRKVVGYPAVWLIVEAVRDAVFRRDKTVPFIEFVVSKLEVFGGKMNDNSIYYPQVTQRGPVKGIWLPHL